MTNPNIFGQPVVFNEEVKFFKDIHIYIYNKNENKIYCYRHVKPLPEINLNSSIINGQILGHVDNSGYSITPHLHFVIYKINKTGYYKLKSEKIKLLFEWIMAIPEMNQHNES